MKKKSKKEQRGRAATSTKGMFDAALAETTSYENLWDYTWALQDAVGDLIQRTEDNNVADPMGELNDLLEEFCQKVHEAVDPALQLNENAGADAGDDEDEDSEGEELDEEDAEFDAEDPDTDEDEDGDEDEEEDEDEDEDEEQKAAVKAARQFLSRKASTFLTQLRKADGDSDEDEDEDSDDDEDPEDEDTTSSEDEDDPEKMVINAAMAFHRACKALDETSTYAAGDPDSEDEDSEDNEDEEDEDNLDKAEDLAGDDEDSDDEEDEDEEEDEDDDEDDEEDTKRTKSNPTRLGRQQSQPEARPAQSSKNKGNAKAKIETIGKKQPKAESIKRRKSLELGAGNVLAAGRIAPAPDSSAAIKALEKQFNARFKKLEREALQLRAKAEELEEVAADAVETAERLSRIPEPRARENFRY